MDSIWRCRRGQCKWYAGRCWNARESDFIFFHFVSLFHFWIQLRFAGCIGLWKDNIIIVHRWTATTKFWRDLGARRASWLTGVGRAGTTYWLYATRIGTLWWIYVARNTHLFRLDCRHVDTRSRGKNRFSHRIASIAKCDAFREKFEWRPTATNEFGCSSIAW